MEIRDWSKFLLPYEQAVEELKVKFRALRQEMKARHEYSPIEFVTGRVKRVSSILEKAKRLGVSMDRLEVGIEDIAGIRIMCQFVEDIGKIAELIRGRKDMLVVYEKDYVANKKESGYRSYHIIIEYPVQTSLGTKPVLAELQIRTLAMNFWATIEHSLNYKFREQIPDEVRIRLRRAAEAAFRLDEEMSSIREEIVAGQKLFEDNSNLVSRVLNDIQELYFYYRIRDAAHYQLMFNRIWEAGDMEELKRLAERLRETLQQVKSSL